MNQQSAKRQAARWPAALCTAVIFAICVLCGMANQTPPAITVVVRRVVHLSGAQPKILQASILRDGSFVIFSGQAIQDFVSLGIFSKSGGLVKDLAGTNVPTGLGRLTGVQVNSRGILWATTLIPAEVARLNQYGLVSVSELAKLNLAYTLALDESRRYVYVGGCAPAQPGANFQCLLVHQFAIDGMRLRKSFLQTDPSVIRNTQFGIQWVPLDVDARGIVWAIDSPAFTLYSIDPTTGNVVSHRILSHSAKPPGKLNPVGGVSYMQNYFQHSFYPNAVIAIRDQIVVGIRQPGGTGGAGYLLEIFNSAGVQVGMDVPSPGRLVGKYGTGGLLFGGSDEGGPTLIEAVLSDSRGTRG